MKTGYKFILCLALFGFMANVHSAIVYQSDDRYINHTMASGSITPVAPYADFNANWWAYEAGAYQNSTLTSSTMSGSGSTYAGYDAMHYGAIGTSVFSVAFTVDQLTDFNLAGSLDSNLYPVNGDLFITLTENEVNIFSYNVWELADVGINPFAYNGQFAAGSNYQLVLSSSMYYSEYYNETWSFNLTTAPAVPVPAAVWLFGSGLLGLAGLARRKAI